MNQDLTISSLTFAQGYSDKTGSLRTEVSRGVNLPEILEIKHSKYVDSATKVPGTQSAVKLSYYKALADGRIVPVVVGLVKFSILEDANVGSTEVLAVRDRLDNLLSESGSGLKLSEEIFVGKQQ